MLFNSLEFALFLPIVFLLYWFVFNRNYKIQNLLILFVSYIFYGYWDWRFLFLIAFSSALDFIVGNKIYSSKSDLSRKTFLAISLISNLGLLAVFKYYNFFIDAFCDAFSFFGQHLEPSRLDIILPVGISFYTFQTLSYTIDIYKKKLVPSKDVIQFFAFVSFFPQLVAGPIERATNLLPQFDKKRTFNYVSAVDGLQQMLWGLFKKVVIADNCAIIVNDIFSNYQSESSISLICGAILFAFQIYCDFSGYSDIAIGTSRLFGFNLMQNFAFPYFSRDIAEFWRRWHISLSTWFRDYLYIPLGGSRVTLVKKIRNIFIIFIVSGFWHGANWTFLFWGFLNALYFLPNMLLNKNRIYLDTIASNRLLPSLKDFFNLLATFLMTCLAWVFFRSSSISDAFSYINRIFKFENSGLTTTPSLDLVILIFILLITEWINRKKLYGLQFDVKRNKAPRYFIYFILMILIYYYIGEEEQSFIYFQF